jgi:histidinol-phosphate aminotransferase
MKLTPLAASLPSTVPFIGPESQERQRSRPFKARLGANESLFGPSPKAIEAIKSAAAEIWKYGDPENYDLRTALAKHHGCPLENITVGEGIDALLGNLTRLIITQNDPVATSNGAYPTFNFHVASFGGTLHKAPFQNDHEHPEALLNLAHQTRAKLIYLSNPNNPMGSHHPAATIKAMIAALPNDCLLILDEAYIDLAPPGTEPTISPDDPRVIRMRTFSKGYGLAGLRVGYAIGAAPLITAFNKVRNHFGVGRIAQAGALAALTDQGHLDWVRNQVIATRESFGKVARENGLLPLPSATNFLTLDCGQDGDFARRVLTELLARDIFVRMPGVAPLDRCIRVSLGGAAELAAFSEALPSALKTARG